MKIKKSFYQIACDWCGKDIFTNKSIQRFCNINHKVYWARKYTIRGRERERIRRRTVRFLYYQKLGFEWREKHPDYMKLYGQLHGHKYRLKLKYI